MPTADHLIFSRRQRRTQRAGFTIVQVMVAMAVIVICGIAGVQALIHVNQKAAAMRLLTNARAVVQRNIDTALCVPFSSSIEPPILVITSAGGAVYDDDGGGDNLVNLALTRSGTDATVRGTLTRTVLAEANADGADIRRVNFRLDYVFRRRCRSRAICCSSATRPPRCARAWPRWRWVRRTGCSIRR